MVAAENPMIEFVISLGGMGISGDSLIESQNRDVMKIKNIDKSEAEEHLKIISFLMSRNKEHSSHYILNNIEESAAKAITLLGLEDNQYTRTRLSQLILAFSTPWIHFFTTYDPQIDITKVQCRVLALNGEKDTQVYADSNLTAIQNYLTKSGNKRVTTKKYPNLNHLFQSCKTGNVDEYHQIEETISPAVLNDIYTWVNNNKIDIVAN